MIDSKKLIEILKVTAEKIDAEKEYLTKLDNDIADGDHGINLAKGYKAIVAKLDTMEGKDAGAILKNAGMTLVSTVGGSSGPLYGTAYMKAGAVLKDMHEISNQDFVKAFEAAIAGVKMRGKSSEGEKTMLDAMCPAYRALVESLASGAELKEAMEKAVKAAYEGIEYTKTIRATKGRASYIGDRSIGYQDPGATSITYVMESVLKCL